MGVRLHGEADFVRRLDGSMLTEWSIRRGFLLAFFDDRLPLRLEISEASVLVWGPSDEAPTIAYGEEPDTGAEVQPNGALLHVLNLRAVLDPISGELDVRFTNGARMLIVPIEGGHEHIVLWDEDARDCLVVGIG